MVFFKGLRRLSVAFFCIFTESVDPTKRRSREEPRQIGGMICYQAAQELRIIFSARGDIGGWLPCPFRKFTSKPQLRVGGL